MRRITRTCWWLAQGILLSVIVASAGYFVIGAGLWCFHACGAIYSQYIQEAQ